MTKLPVAGRPAGGRLPARSGNIRRVRIRDGLLALTRRVGSTRLGVLLIGRVVSPMQRSLYRATNGRISLTGRAPVLLLTATGRRSGRPHTVPLIYVADGRTLVVCNVNPGFERPNPWTLNLSANRRAKVEIRGATFTVDARMAAAEEVDRYWPQFVALWPAYERFYKQGGKRQLFVLTPTDMTP
jgi:deazaflavin-dependent oxidoreductase (nitroreductase family)